MVDVIDGAAGWMRCPDCGSTQMEGGNFNADGRTVWQHVNCTECPAYWTDVYVASHRERDEVD